MEALDFLGGIPCPVKYPYKDALQEYLKEKNNNVFNYYPSEKNEDIVFEEFYKYNDIKELPSVISFGRLGEFYNRFFMDKFLNKDYFISVNNIEEVHDIFLEAKLLDPKKEYTVYGACPTIMVIDTNKLGNLPEPKTWDDLFNPIYKDNIILSGPGEEGVVDETILLYFYKEYGEDGIKKLAQNVKCTCHTTEIGHIIANNNNKGAAIYVQWAFFAGAYPKKDNIKIIWPEDGALVTPLCALVKREKKEKIEEFIEFLFSKELGNKMCNLGFPMVNKRINNNLEPSMKLKWLGWEYIRANDIDILKLYIEDIFKIYWNNYKKTAPYGDVS